MSPYNVGMNGVPIGLIVVAPNEYDQAPPVAVLSQITSVSSLIAYLNLMKEFVSFDDMGQFLKNNLQLVSSANFMAPANGYRADIDNHLLVYITSSTLFDADPVPVARTILNTMKYGMVTIGYGTHVDHEKLRKIAGGKPCSYSASNETELNSHIKSIRRHILYADANSGKYCGNL
ncbi:hypothetical protein CAEBREN_01767 [Caenorhabditis brenneri]|uniref:VWFA domain-containing protein n=1 Tax=Caenorhabditis brenneri TaxID=135651 RepID=G0M7I1_CAEBE|nr:hypothetical protein CAEBREN_01767 [Caenorhabditis brenneri]